MSTSFRLIVLCIILGIVANAENLTKDEQARELYNRLTGLKPMPESIVFQAVQRKVLEGDLTSAAKEITDSTKGAREFYDSILLQFGAAFNQAETGLNDANDLSALIIGNTRDNGSIDSLLTDDIYYNDPTVARPTNNRDIGTDRDSSWSETSNNHYRFLSKNKSLRDALQRVSRNTIGNAATMNHADTTKSLSGTGRFSGVGIFTTRAWAEEFLSAGTNRRAWEYIIRLLYCAPQTAVKDINVPDHYVARDVPRVNAGDPLVFHRDCKGCHGMMDAGGRRAFLKFDYDTYGGNATVFRLVQHTTVNDKLNERNHSTEPVTSEDWYLFATPNQNKLFGFQSLSASGMGLRDFARLVAGSSGWLKCMTTRVVSQMYLKKPYGLNALTSVDFDRLRAEEETISRLSGNLEKHRNLRTLFEEAAIEYLKAR